MTFRVLITCRQLQSCLDRYIDWLGAHGISIEAPPVIQQLSETELLPLVGDIDGLIVGDDHVTNVVIAAAPRLKVICKWGIGLDAINVEAAAQRGIPVYNTPGLFGNEVADVAMGYILMLARGLHRIDQSVRAGGWLKVRGATLAGRRVGVIGLGSIGKAVVKRAVGFGMVPLGCDPNVFPDEEFDRCTGLRRLPLETMLREADIVVAACSLTPATRHMLNDHALSLLRPGAWVINVCRGPVVDEAALVRALETGQIGGAGLDVFETEPLPLGNPLRSFESVVLGSHNASNTVEGVERVNVATLENLLTGLGIPKRSPLN